MHNLVGSYSMRVSTNVTDVYTRCICTVITTKQDLQTLNAKNRSRSVHPSALQICVNSQHCLFRQQNWATSSRSARRNGRDKAQFSWADWYFRLVQSDDNGDRRGTGMLTVATGDGLEMMHGIVSLSLITSWWRPS